MEQYSKLVMMLVVWIVSCHGQHVSHVNVEQLHSRVRELEEAVEQLLKPLDMPKFQTVSAKAAAPTIEKRGFMFPSDISALNAQYTPDVEVGFHVSLTDEFSIQWKSNLPFDTVVENIGGAYNRDAAEFTCPISGTYLFSLNIGCQKDSYVELSVQINNGNGTPRFILNTVCDHRQRSVLDVGKLYCGNTQNGGTAIVSLAQGETVSVKKIWPVGGISTITGHGFSSFSGYLLRPSYI